MGVITTVGIDLAKNVFSVHGVDAHGKAVLRKTVGRGKLLELMAQLPPCLVGMEACSGAHQMARELQPLGHTPRIMMPQVHHPVSGAIRRTTATTPRRSARQSADPACVSCRSRASSSRRC